MNNQIIAYHARAAKFLAEQVFPPVSDCCNAYTERVGDEQDLCLLCGELCCRSHDW